MVFGFSTFITGWKFQPRKPIDLSETRLFPSRRANGSCGFFMLVQLLLLRGNFPVLGFSSSVESGLRRGRWCIRLFAFGCRRSLCFLRCWVGWLWFLGLEMFPAWIVHVWISGIRSRFFFRRGVLKFTLWVRGRGKSTPKHAPTERF